MELPTYIFSIPGSVKEQVAEKCYGHFLKTALSEELESELRALERSSLDWDQFSEATEGQSSGNLVNLLREAFDERSRQLSGTPAYTSLLNRRARISLLEMRTHVSSGGQLHLEMAPGHIVAALEGQTGEWFSMVLERHLADLYTSNRGDESPKGLLLSKENIPDYQPSNESFSSSSTRSVERESRLDRTIRRFGAFLLLVPIVLVGLILFLFYTWVADVKQEYDDLANTVNIQKEQIIKVVEEGLERSTDVMDIIDVVKDVTLGRDTTDQE